MDNDNRALRYRGRHALRRVTTVERCHDCGREPTGSGVGIRRTESGVVGFAGLVSCGRVWLCPVCNAKIMAVRAIEIGAVLTHALDNGWHVVWGSLTCQHDSTSNLADLLEIQQAAWRHVVSSKTWRSTSSTTTVTHGHTPSCAHDCDRQRDTILTTSPGRVGYIRASEITTSELHGWHPHFHPLIFVRGTKKLAEQIARDVVALWIEGVKDAGGFAQAHGAQQLKVIEGVKVYDALAGYVTKGTYDTSRLALELVWSQGKVKRRGRIAKTVAHWSLLAAVDLELADGGRVAGLEAPHLWTELEEATHRHRMIAWSRGLRDFAGLTAEKTNEEIAETEVGTEQDSVAFITPTGWASIRDRPDVLALLLAGLQSGGFPVLKLLLDAHGVDYLTDWSFRSQPKENQHA